MSKTLPKKPNKQPKPIIPEGEPHKMGYARVSMADQDPQLQINALIAAGVDPREIWEEKVSGGAIKRPELENMLREIQPGDHVYVWKLDRLGRNARHLYQIAEDIVDRGGRLIILTMPGMDTGTAVGKVLFGIMAIFAEFERSLIRERTVAGLKVAKEAGRVGGRVSKWTDEEALEARKLGIEAGAKKLKMTKAGFIRRVEKAKANMAAKGLDQ